MSISYMGQEDGTGRQSRSVKSLWVVKRSEKFPGTPTYDCCQPWVYKESSDGSITADLFVYVDNGRPIGPTEEVFWKSSRRWLLV